MIEGLYLHNTHMISNYNLSPHIIKYHNRWAYVTCLIILLVSLIYYIFIYALYLMCYESVYITPVQEIPSLLDYIYSYIRL